MSEIVTSKQFQYALFQAIFGLVLVVLAALAAWLGTDQSWEVLVAALCTGAIPVIKRLAEGIGDANRNIEGAVIPSDVTPNS